MSASVTEFTRRLEELETNRPSPGGDHGQFQKVKSYREAVVRLSLGMLATTAFGHRSIEDEIRATQSDTELNILFRIAMQCQIIDDVLDYSKDAIAGLPSFLTAAASLPQALELTHEAALGYANIQDLRHIPETFPLRLALSAVSDCARLVIAVGRPRKSLQSGKLICSVNSAVLRAESIVNEPLDLRQSMSQTITAPTNGDTSPLRSTSLPVFSVRTREVKALMVRR